MALPWIREPSHVLLLAVLEAAKQLTRHVCTLIVAFLVWLELKTGLVLSCFALYDKHPHIIQILFVTIIFGVLYVSVHTIRRQTRTPHYPEPFSSSPYRHNRQETPIFPPGMEFNHVQERWKRDGMEKPFLERREFGADRPAEVPPVRRTLFCVPTSGLPPPRPVKPPVNAKFGKVGWS
jgi:hypothetical protein